MHFWETEKQMYLLVMKLPWYSLLLLLLLFPVDWTNFLKFLYVSKSAKFGVEGVFLPAGDFSEQFAVSLQSYGVKGAGQHGSRHSNLVTPSVQELWWA